MAYKLHFLHNDLPKLHKQVHFSTTIPPLLMYLECSPSQCVIKKINNAVVKFVIISQQTSSEDLCVNIAHIKNEAFCCNRKYTKFVRVSFQFIKLQVFDTTQQTFNDFQLYVFYNYQLRNFNKE